MKKSIIITVFAVCIIIITAFKLTNKSQKSTVSNQTCIDQIDTNQRIFFFVHGSHYKPITIDKLANAELISDLIHQYPTNWITEYIGVDLLTNKNGKEYKANSPNDTLTGEQIKLIKSLDLHDHIGIIVYYKSINAVTNLKENRQIEIDFTVVPMVDAEFIGGPDELNRYLEENSLSKISEITKNIIQETSIFFNIDENGEIKKVELIKSSGNTEIDDLLIELVNSMPKWIPAQNIKGISVSQEFELNIGGC